MELVGGVEESLGWDTSYVEAGTSECASLLDANSLEASLAGLNCGDVSYLTQTNEVRMTNFALIILNVVDITHLLDRLQ